MKTVFISFITLSLLLLISCRHSDKKEEKNTSENAQTETVISSKENGNYTGLFERQSDNCDFITAEELSEVLGVSPSAIETAGNDCGYIVTETNGINIWYYFSVQEWNRRDIESQIQTSKDDMESLGEDSRLTHIQKSETGDTWLAMNQDRYIMVLNENYNNVITIQYTPKFNNTEKDVEAIRAHKDEARNNAYKIANYLLKKYKK